jgi:hypothetical protein
MTHIKAGYIPFVKDKAVNRDALRDDLAMLTPTAFIHFEEGNELLQSIVDFLPNDCYFGTVEVYDNTHVNAFVKVNPSLPAVGFVKVRPNVIPIDMTVLMTWADVVGEDDFDAALGCYIDDVDGRLNADLEVPADLGALRTEFEVKYKRKNDPMWLHFPTSQHSS